jgi:rare lipoprotein A (peptidoglycan hydrolase)
MRRSLRLIAAAWFLALGACAKEPPAKEPPSRAPAAQAARPQSGAASGPAHRSQAVEGRADATRHAGGPSGGEQLAQRYARARALAVHHGSASYYSDAFAGRSTASGAPYQPHDFTAAHRSLAFGTVLRVTRKDGGQSVYVRITDRGPFARGRIVDLSRAAAEKLGMLRAGVVKVKVEVVEYGQPRQPRRRRR